MRIEYQRGTRVASIHRHAMRLTNLSDPKLTQLRKRIGPINGQYLAFIHAYTLVLGRPPAEADLHDTSPLPHLQCMPWCFRSSVQA